MWREGVAVDLTQQIDSADPLSGAVTLISAFDINDRGQITAFGRDSANPEAPLRLYLLDPVR